MNQPPLNPDALEAATWAVSLAEREIHTNESLGKQRHIARSAVSAYLAAALPETRCVERHSPDLVCDGCEPPTPALPEVTSVESIPAKMRMLMWEGGEVEVGEIPDGYVLVGFEMETDRAWSMADKVTINIERPEVKP